mmetsp:Transcript_13463/g.31682  ORF Transcript_13463/g.31682 Transcript_13463/m.31682 type:complete len:504 (-) Transcript_13463:2234-3745(-)
MTTTANEVAALARESKAMNSVTTGYRSSLSPPLTFKSVIQDVASWWCYAILKHGDLRLFDELDHVLDSLPKPFLASSPLSIRLRCLVPWHELLKQLYTPGYSLGEKQFETIQDKLLLLHKGFFFKNTPTEEFNDVLRMIQTHTILSKLYNFFAHNGDCNNETTNKILEQCNGEWKSIYLDSDGVPPSLLDLVDKTNGWDFEDRRDHILQIVSFPDSPLTYKRLKRKMQSLLLHWFEHEISDVDETGAKVPELLRKRYRNIGYGKMEDISQGITEATEFMSKRSATCNFPTSPITDQSLLQRKKSRASQMSFGQQQNAKKRRSLEQVEKANIVFDPPDVDNWFDLDPEEVPKQLQSEHERKNRFLAYSHEQKISTGRRMEKLLSMPVGEPSYSEASPHIRENYSQKRRSQANNDAHPRCFATARFGSKTEEISSNSSTSSRSGLINFDEENSRWTQEEDNALKNGIKWNGYGNWIVIRNEEKLILGSRDENELRKRANQLLAHR